MFKLRMKQIWNLIKSIVWPLLSDMKKAALEKAKTDISKEIATLKQKLADKKL